MSLRDVMKKFVVIDEQGAPPAVDPTEYDQPEPPPAPSPAYTAPPPPPQAYAPPQPPPPAPPAYEPPPTYVSPPSPTLPPTVLLRQPAADPAPAPAAPAPALSGDELAAIYQQAGIPQIAWGAEEALGFIADQPVEEPDATVRRNLLGCIRTLRRTFPGLTPDTVAEDARLKSAALTSSSGEQSAKLAKFVADTEREIGALREQIQQRLRAIDAAKTKDLQTAQRLRDHAERLKKVEEFLRTSA